MTIIKKILIFITILLFTIILWRLIIVRINLTAQFNKEGFSNGNSAKCKSSMLSSLTLSAEDKDLCKSEIASDITIQNASNDTRNLPLKEFCIKASYNSACSGNYINLDMLQYIIHRGVRFLDFEVFYMEDDSKKKSGTTSEIAVPILKPVVSTSVDPHFALLTSENSILLDNVLSAAVSNAFSSPCPNYGDPLFINLRIKSSDPSIYEAVAASIDSTIKDKIYTDSKSETIFTNAKANKHIKKAGKVTKNTLLKDVMGKVIISIDKTIFPNYRNHTACSSTVDNCYDLTNYTNVEQGSEDMNSVLYKFMARTNMIQINDDNKHTNVKTITVANPDNDFLSNKASFNSIVNPPNNPDNGLMLLSYSSQIVPYRFYNNDSALAEYEEFFNIHNSAFVPLYIAVSHYRNQQNKASGLL
jgi:hypothetical protein